MLISTVTYSQCIVTQDESNRIITICQGDTPTKNGFLINRPDRGQVSNQTVYLGNPYLTYPIYREGTLEMSSPQGIIPCKIAFNLIANEVSCLLPGDATEQAVLPDAFTVDGKRFVARTESSGKRLYYEVLYAGKSRVLAHYKATLTAVNREPYQFDDEFDGTYNRQERYFIEFVAQPLQEVTLSKKTVMKLFHTTSNSALAKTKDKLTLMELIEAVASYDGFQ
ncbi:hypothetical protein GCM10028805_49250 [Spirosoma harenae]